MTNKRKPPETGPLPAWAAAGPEIVETIGPDSDPVSAALAACYRCVSDSGSTEPLKDIRGCRSDGCIVWKSREKFLLAIDRKRGG